MAAMLEKIIFFISVFFGITSLSSAYNYCSVTSRHTMCRFSRVGKACGTKFISKPPSKSEISYLLHWHNSLRQRVALGKENYAREALPQAANMMKMHWDEELATVAQRLADQCVYDHDCNKCRQEKWGRFEVGQNIAMMDYVGTSPKIIDYKRTIHGWYEGEIQFFSKNYISRFVFQPTWGHYSQVIWWNTRAIGCGASIFVHGKTTKHLVVCNYGPTGNWDWKEVYTVGRPCSQCPELTKCDTKYKGLCTPVSRLSERTSLPSDKQLTNGWNQELPKSSSHRGTLRSRT